MLRVLRLAVNAEALAVAPDFALQITKASAHDLAAGSFGAVLNGLTEHDGARQPLLIDDDVFQAASFFKCR